jgi:hypothetical protein
MALQKAGIERMIFEAALFLILVLAMTVPIVKAYEWLQDSVRSVHQSTQMKPGRAD